MQQRLEKLELLYMEQEQMLETFSEQLYLQQRDIHRLQQEIRQLQERLKNMSTSLVASATEETPPPHY